MPRTFVWLALFFAQVAAAQQRVAAASDHDLIQQLLARVAQLEAEVRELRGQSEPAAAPVPKPPVVEPAQAAGEMSMRDPQALGLAGMQFRGFSDLQYHASDERGATNSFGLGQFNLFITSKLSDRVSVLAEAVLEAGADNAFGFDLERLLLQYSANDYFNVAVGRYHTAIGWYNTAYHHATWLQTAVDRPFLFDFEDQGGILPIHNVGLSVTGRIPSGRFGLRYTAEVGNGRASRSRLDEPVQNVRDENDGKAFNFALNSRPEALPGFETGFSLYRDRLTPLGLPSVGQTIFAAHAIYQTSGLEFLNEGVLLRNAVRGGPVLHTPGFYTQLSRRYRWIRPYFRYQYVNVPSGDPMYGDVGLMHGPSLGARYDFSEFAAFKLQYDRTARRRLGAVNGFTTQLSFTF